MEFKEFIDPLSKDYDLKISTIEEEPTKTNIINPYKEELFSLMDDIPEDIEYMTDEEFQERYGITKKEYSNPTAETIEKYKSKSNSGRHK